MNNILAFKIVDTQKGLKADGSEFTEYETISVKEWDNKEHIGDDRFVKEVRFDTIEDNGHPTEVIVLSRPSDFDEAERWVNDNIKMKANRTRFIEMFDKMRRDTAIHFWFTTN